MLLSLRICFSACLIEDCAKRPRREGGVSRYIACEDSEQQDVAAQRASGRRRLALRPRIRHRARRSLRRRRHRPWRGTPLQLSARRREGAVLHLPRPLVARCQRAVDAQNPRPLRRRDPNQRAQAGEPKPKLPSQISKLKFLS